MKIRYSALLLIGAAMALSQWGCKNNNSVVGTGTPVTVTISGMVVASNSATPIGGAMVVLTHSGIIDSVVTPNDGTFQFTIDLSDTSGVDVSLLIHALGYNSYSNTFKVTGNQSFQVSLSINSSDYAVVNGAVRDSTSAWPLPGASVIVSLPGGSGSAMKYLSYFKSNVKSISSFIIDSTTTGALGTFILNIPFPSYLDSVSATMTVSKAGFVTYQAVRTFKKGVTENVVVLLQQDKTQSVAHLVGQVVDRRSLMPITNVSVILTSTLRKDSTKTLSDGSYSFDFNLPGASSSVSGTLLFRLASYNDTTVSFSVNAGQTLTENVALSAKPTVVGGDSATGRGIARSIKLMSVTPQEISIHGVGRNETSVAVWQVVDSLGFPIDISHQATVSFSIAEGPNGLGGAYVTPTKALTDGSGQVSTTINSGTAAGTIQLNAQLTLANGTVVQTAPVLITVDGGLPDQGHFELNSNLPHSLNFAGYDWSEVTQGFTVQAGDKYGNPVAPGTAIYFSTTAGVITASGQTDVTGHAPATLYSGLPLPKLSGLDPAYFGDGTGYAYVKAFTQGENGAIIADSGLICISAQVGSILFDDSSSIAPVIIHSGAPAVSVPVHISDRFGNPLEAGTTVSATVVVTPPPSGTSVTWSVDATGLPSSLDDHLTRGPGSTEFTLLVSGSENEAVNLSYTVTVTVTGRNGKSTNTFSGVLEP